MTSHLTGFLALVKKENLDIFFTRCFIHKNNFVAKSLMSEVNEVFQTVVKIVNLIKSKPLKSRLFNCLCSAMDTMHTDLLSHTKVRCLFRGWTSRGVIVIFYL